MAGTVLTACGSASPSVELPSRTASPGPATSSAQPSAVTGTQSPQQQAAEKQYLAFWAAAARAQDAGTAAKARAILTPYAYPSLISTMVSGMQPAWNKHEVLSGAAVERVQSVDVASVVKGQYFATVRDCQDTSHEGLANAATGKLVAGSLGAAHQQLYTYMDLVNGSWLVQQVTFVADKCTS